MNRINPENDQPEAELLEPDQAHQTIRVVIEEINLPPVEFRPYATLNEGVIEASLPVIAAYTLAHLRDWFGEPSDSILNFIYNNTTPLPTSFALTNLALMGLLYFLPSKLRVNQLVPQAVNLIHSVSAALVMSYHELSFDGCNAEGTYCNVSDPKDVPAYVIGAGISLIYNAWRINKKYERPGQYRYHYLIDEEE